MFLRVARPLEFSHSQGSWSCDNALMGALTTEGCCEGCAAASCLDRRHQRLDTYDVHDPRQIVGENAERHLGGDFRQCLCQEVRRAHARLDRAEGVLDRLAPLAHRLWILVESALQRLARSRHWETMAYSAAVAAFSINAATSDACERKIAWLPGSSMTCDCARFVMNRSRSGLIIRSCMGITA